MSTWITPAGSLGNFTQNRAMDITLQATPSLGGTVVYQLVNSTQLPPGLNLNPQTGKITGTPQYVEVDTRFIFQISATEITPGAAIQNIRNFSITITTVTWITPQGLQGSFPENEFLIVPFQASPSQPGNTLRYSLLNGRLPAGNLGLSDSGVLTGVPSEVAKSTVSEFTVRVREFQGLTMVGFSDRTFSIEISGSTAPYFITAAGNILTVNDSTWQQYQINYFSPDPDTAEIITVSIGTLPPGLEISPSGLIRGYANPPVDDNNNPIPTRTYTFTLKISSISGSSYAQYSITINNQEFIPGFQGRAPTILNTQPLTYVIPDTDPYKNYYLSSNSLGSLPQSEQFIFKFIGYDFDGDNLTYDILGLENVGVENNSQTGWQNGQLINVGDRIQTYNITARVYKTNKPTISSATFLLTITIVGSIDTGITWNTNSNLGIINNGEVSYLGVNARSGENVELNYRIVSNQISADLNTIVGTGLKFQTFGSFGAYVTGSQDGTTWTVQPNIQSIFGIYNFTSAVYDSANQNTIISGFDQNNSGLVIQLFESGNWSRSTVNSQYPLRSVILSDGLFVSVGDNGTIITTNDPSNWVNSKTSGTPNSLNSVSWSGTLYVAVGDLGTILTSNDTNTWTARDSGTTVNLKSITWAGDKFVAVGDLGKILTSTDGIDWQIDETYSFNFAQVTYSSSNGLIIAVGAGGIIIRSDDGAESWSIIENSITTVDLDGIYYDDVNTNSFYIVGASGTVLIYNPIVTGTVAIGYSTLTSPTVPQLPPDLILLPTGEISGRLAFESTTAYVDEGTTTVYNFSVQAYSTEFSQINSTKSFSLTTRQRFYLPYDNIYIQAMPPSEDRIKLNSLLNSSSIIPDDYLYRPQDPYFGKSSRVKYQHMFAVPSQSSEDLMARYLESVRINHYWRNITLGEIKTAVARNSSGTIIYEVVYSEIQDDLVNSQGQSISKQITWPRDIDLGLNDWVTANTSVYSSNTYYGLNPIVATVQNTISDSLIVELNTVSGIEVGMNVVGTAGSVIDNKSDGTPPLVTAIDPATNTVTLDIAQSLSWSDQILFEPPVYTSLTPGVARVLYPNSLNNMRTQVYDTLGFVDDPTILPLWMTSQQLDGNTLGYRAAWVICYVKPGRSAQVKANIETLWPYKLNQIDFELDRFEIDRSKTYNYLGTTGTPPSPVWNTLPSAQPDVVGNSQDVYVYYPRKTILPDKYQG